MSTVPSRGQFITSPGAYTASTTSQELAAMLSSPILPSIVVRVYGPAGEVTAASPNSVAAPPVAPRPVLARPAGPAYDALVALAPPFITVDAGRGAFGTASNEAESRWRVYVMPLDGPETYLLAASPLENIDASLAAFRWLMPGLALAASLVTLIAGRLIAGRALRPVAVLTETAGAIARSRGFGQRVPIGARPDELGQLAATFNEMLTSLEQAYRAQQRFVADASHELRAPLTAIQANLELLHRQPNLSAEERSEAVTEANREAYRLSRLVADLLALARADAGVPLRRQRVELDRVVVESLAHARRLANGQQIELSGLEPALVDGDPDRLKQVLLVLADNAIKYTPTGGQITLGLRRNGGTAEIAVRDTGIGIPPEALPHVFDRFYRADPARARDPAGTGLGLAIARWIVEQHGGRIALVSVPGGGTVATVSLPLAA